MAGLNFGNSPLEPVLVHVVVAQYVIFAEVEFLTAEFVIEQGGYQ